VEVAMPPIPFTIERKELERMKDLQVRCHREWPAAFSTNSLGRIWLFTHSGNTPIDEREFVDGMFEFIEHIAEIYRYERPGGGRFFVSERGCFYHEEGMPEIQFIEFLFLD
jgi:hypothetical protein